MKNDNMCIWDWSVAVTTTSMVKLLSPPEENISNLARTNKENKK